MSPPHPLERLASTPVPLNTFKPGAYPIREAEPLRPPLAYVDGWYNDLRTRRTLFH